MDCTLDTKSKISPKHVNNLMIFKVALISQALSTRFMLSKQRIAHRGVSTRDVCVLPVHARRRGQQFA